MTIRVRHALAGEATLLGEIGYTAWRDSALGAADAGRNAETDMRLAYIRFCTRHFGGIRVAEMSNEPVGWGAREVADHYISDMWVLPAARGRGVGASLLAALEAEIAALGFTAAELEVNALNRDAIRFYEKHGYSAIWRGEKFAPVVGYVIDKVRFSKALQPGTNGNTESPRICQS